MSKAKAFIQGSYFNPTDHFSYCGIIYFKDKKYIIKGSINNGEYIAMKELRGQASWFIKGCKNGAKLRDEISKIQTMDDLNLIVSKALEAGN